MSVSEPSSPRWPAHLKELCQELVVPRDEASRNAAREEAWLLLNSAISMYLRLHASRLGAISQEDREDIASEKSLGLIRKIEAGENDMPDRHPGEIASYLSKVAKNRLLDQRRETARRVLPVDENRPEWDLVGTEENPGTESPDAPDVLAEHNEFAEALVHCVGELAPRSRLVWFLRVFCDLPSKRIASHPEIRLKVGYVDVLLQRAREAIRDCMRCLGHDRHDLPPGVFVELLRVFRLDEVQVTMEEYGEPPTHSEG